MKISINGKMISTDARLLIDIIKEYGAKPPYALAVNGEFVAKSDYQQKQISDQDQIDIVSPIFGG